MSSTPRLHQRDLVALQRAAGNQAVGRLLRVAADERSDRRAPEREAPMRTANPATPSRVTRP
jgi:hypothetical protein